MINYPNEVSTPECDFTGENFKTAGSRYFERFIPLLMIIIGTLGILSVFLA